MDIVYMNGGLGNQVFQYIFARYLEETKGEQVLIDDMHFFLYEDQINYNLTNNPANTPDKTTHNGYELEYVFPNASKPTLMSQYFDEDVWQHMKTETMKMPLQRLGVFRQLWENDVDLILLLEAGDIRELDGLTCPIYHTEANRYNSAAAKLGGDVYFFGYWINPGWFNRYREKFLKEFAFRPLTDPLNLQYMNEIQNSYSIGVHIRRGDFVRLNWALPEDYYYTEVKNLSARENAKFFVFSDDLEWCKNNMKELGFSDKNTVFVDGNYDYKNNYIDMQLMSMCNVIIEGASSFSYLASLLNQTPGFRAVRIRNNPEDDINGHIQRVTMG